MAGNKTIFLENKLLDYVLRGVSYIAPLTVYVALFTAAPGENGGGTEVIGNGYVRQVIQFTPAVNGMTANSNTIVFPTSQGSWGVITHFAILDDPTAGNMLYYGQLSSLLDISAANRKVQFEIGALTVAES